MLTQANWSFLSFLNRPILSHVEFRVSSVADKRSKTDIWYNTGSCIYFNMSFLVRRSSISGETKRTLIRDYFLLTVCALSLPPNEAIISTENRICNILYPCLIYWLEQWLFIDIVIIIMHWQQGPYTVFLFRFFLLHDWHFFLSLLFWWSALISDTIVEHNSSLRGRSV